MAELVLSAFLTAVFEKLGSAALKQLTSSKEIQSELKKWERSLSLIRGVLNDASQKEVTNEAVKQWLIGLQHLAYDIDDILDGLATDAMVREFANDSKPITCKVKKLIPACCTNFSSSNNIKGKLGDITTKLQELVDEKTNLGLSVIDGVSKNKYRKYQTSLVDASSIVGRESDKKILLEKLLGDEPCKDNFSIVPIVGMGGIGKTTLARLLYDDKLVKECFELKAWVCVSEEFDSFTISKIIYQCVGGENKEFADLNLLQVALRDQLMGKRFLLVLDDVWSEKIEDWETLVGPFLAAAPGSKVIITTRKQQLLNKLGYGHPYNLKKLSHNDALSLFAQHTLGVNNFDMHPQLISYGERIVQKCDGLPLALRALGSLLRTKTNEEEWEELLNHEIWGLEDGGGIVPALRLSYQDLSACSKQLFAYCSLLPKDYMFKKEELILLWMAEGFFHKSTAKSMERLGEEYFQQLLSRSFFEHVPHDESLFMMHDLMNDLATSVAGEFFIRSDIDMEKNVGKQALKKYRHMSFIREEYITFKKFKALETTCSLRTLLAVPIVVRDSWHTSFLSNKVLADLLTELPLLRVLCLSELEIDEIPESVGSLKHLRYLNVSRTKITYLPENVCNLNNLQTLIVSGCGQLTKLPDNFLKLKNLRHFDIRYTCLWNRMPLGSCELKSLQTISNIIVGGNNDFLISGLKNVKDLQGKIYIRELDKVQSARDIQEVNLSKTRVSKLQFEWSDIFDDSRNDTLEKDVLNALKPHSDNLKDLEIVWYGGKVFPNWIGDPSFLRLTCISFRSCRNCTFLPPLGKLPSLKKLSIERMDEVKVIGSDLLGTNPAFPSLEILSFHDMRGWEAWSAYVGVIGAIAFPCLKELSIHKCPNLAEVSLEALPSLKILKIKSCGAGVLRSLIHVASSVTNLSIYGISGLTDEVWRDVMDYLGAVEEISIEMCNEIRYLWESEAGASKVLVNLRKLVVSFCDKLVSLGEKEEVRNSVSSHLTSLRMLDMESCKNLDHCSCPKNIESLSLRWCASIKSVSFATEGGQKLKSLYIHNCNQLVEKVLTNTSMPTLEVARIIAWPDLKSVSELTFLVHLKELEIQDCPNIQSFPAIELPILTSLRHLKIRNCQSMDASLGYWPPSLCKLSIGGLKNPITEWGPQNFPTSLVDLQLWGGRDASDVTSGSQLSHVLPSSLTHLRFTGFKKLESLSKGLQHLTSLQHLEIWICPKMKRLPDMLLPSLLRLEISGCPNLIGKTSKKGSYWPLIYHIPCIHID